MSHVSRPSLDSLVPLMMIENTLPEAMDENSASESPKEIFRYFESGDLVLVRMDVKCSPAIVFNASGLVMKFDIDRQLYHVCLLDKQFTEQWIDANDMVSYSVPMIADCDDEETMLMWSTANDLLTISNNTNSKTRLDEFRRRFEEQRQNHQSEPSSPVYVVRKSREENSLFRRSRSSQTFSSTLTVCEEFVIIEAIHRLSQCTFAEAKRVAEETYQKIIYTNNHDQMSSFSIAMISEQWFLTFVVRYIEHFRQYSITWLTELETTIDNVENNNDLSSLISLMKETN